MSLVSDDILECALLFCHLKDSKCNWTEWRARSELFREMLLRERVWAVCVVGMKYQIGYRALSAAFP